MRDWEDAILNRQESEADDCYNCPYKGIECDNSCETESVVINPIVAHWLGKRGK